MRNTTFQPEITDAARRELRETLAARVLSAFAHRGDFGPHDALRAREIAGEMLAQRDELHEMTVCRG